MSPAEAFLLGLAPWEVGTSNRIASTSARKAKLDNVK
jgi:hypothetical protein